MYSVTGFRPRTEDRPQGSLRTAWLPRPSKRRRLLLRSRRRNPRPLFELLPN